MNLLNPLITVGDIIRIDWLGVHYTAMVEDCTSDKLKLTVFDHVNTQFVDLSLGLNGVMFRASLGKPVLLAVWDRDSLRWHRIRYNKRAAIAAGLEAMDYLDYEALYASA